MSYCELLRDQVGPSVRRCGFTGSGGRWTLRDPTSGDVAVVQAQGSRGNSAEEVMFFVNLAVVPQPWWRYMVDLYAHSGEPKEYHGGSISSPRPLRHWARSEHSRPWTCTMLSSRVSSGTK